MVKEKKWLLFELKERKPKTDVYSVLSLCDGLELGIIKWYPSWRHYCFFPTIEIETVYSDRCLIELSEFITRLNKRHKLKQNAKEN